MDNQPGSIVALFLRAFADMEHQRASAQRNAGAVESDEQRRMRMLNSGEARLPFDQLGRALTPQELSGPPATIMRRPYP